MTINAPHSYKIRQGLSRVRAAAPHRAWGWPRSLDLLRDVLSLFTGTGTVLDGMTLDSVDTRPAFVEFVFTRRDGVTVRCTDVSTACAYLRGALHSVATSDPVTMSQVGDKWVVFGGGRSVWFTRLRQHASAFCAGTQAA